MAITEEHQIDFEDVWRTYEDVQPVHSLREDEPVGHLLNTFVRLTDDIDLSIDEIFEGRFIDTATGRELELLGQNVGVERKTGEGDDKYRKRVRAGYQAATSDGTYSDIAQVALLVLDADSGQVSMDRAADTADPATALIEVNSDVIDNSPFTTSEIADLLGDAAVGGHRVIVQQSDVFTWDDSSLGWGTEWGKSIQ